MFDGRKIESAIREVYSFLYPDKKERKKALARLDEYYPPWEPPVSRFRATRKFLP